MNRFLKNNGLTLTLLAVFAVSFAGQWLTGWQAENQDRLNHGQAATSLMGYLANPAFISSVFENWESEFLQMAAYVLLTAILFQKGSAESRDPDAPRRDSDLARQAGKSGAPIVLRRGRFARWIYAHSLGSALFALFILSFGLHWVSSAHAAAATALLHGERPHTIFEHIFSAQLWFESFQNWQSEFLSTAALVVLSIYLRQQESPESKAVAAPHGETGA